MNQTALRLRIRFFLPNMPFPFLLTRPHVQSSTCKDIRLGGDTTDWSPRSFAFMEGMASPFVDAISPLTR
jgi:hypothetical protein